MAHRRLRQPQREAFTLMEVLLVLVILVILGSLAVGMFSSSQRKAQVNAARSQIGAFETPINMYHLDTNQYPPDLESLRTPPSTLGDTSRWGGPYLNKDIPLDPWGSPYQYAYPGRYRPEEYDIWSLGPDGIDGTDDDIGNW